MSFTNFKRTVWNYYRAQGRHSLPWRKTPDPYRILVSEIMLQQTQVDRVIPFYKTFLKRFPTPRRLAAAPLSDVLRAWQGLGYNRRAKYLREAAKIIVARHAGRVPGGYEELLALPGIGPYTASAIRAFSANEPGTFLETNIRTAFIHSFFPKKKHVQDSALMPLVSATIDKKNPREWYFALMDYGAHLKRTEGNAAARSAGYKKQSAFKGSRREVRGAVIRSLSERAQTETALSLLFDARRVHAELAALRKEGLIVLKNGRYRLAD